MFVLFVVVSHPAFVRAFLPMKLKITNKYGVTPNAILNSTQLSLGAKGIYAFIQSKPDGWDFSAEKISHQTLESPKVINKFLKELEASGLLQRNKKSGGKGVWEIEYILKDTLYPFTSNENTSNENTSNENGTNNSKKEFSNKDLSKKEKEDSQPTKKYERSEALKNALETKSSDDWINLTEATNRLGKDQERMEAFAITLKVSLSKIRNELKDFHNYYKLILKKETVDFKDYEHHFYNSVKKKQR